MLVTCRTRPKAQPSSVRLRASVPVRVHASSQACASGDSSRACESDRRPARRGRRGCWGKDLEEVEHDERIPHGSRRVAYLDVWRYQMHGLKNLLLPEKEACRQEYKTWRICLVSIEEKGVYKTRGLVGQRTPCGFVNRIARPAFRSLATNERPWGLCIV